MKNYIAKRFLQLIPILLGITLLSFLLTNSGASDVISLMEANTGRVMSEAEKSRLRADLGLDKPIVQQYVV